MSTSSEEADTFNGAEDLSVSGPAFWAAFESEENREEYFRSWLALQSSLIPDAVQSVLVMREQDADSFEPVCKWSEGDTDAERLAEISERVIEQRCGLLTELSTPTGEESSAPPHYAVAYPVLFDESLHGVVAVEVAAHAESGLKSAMRQLQWGVAWLELFSRRRRVRDDGETLARLTSAVNLLAGVLSKDHFEDACMAFVTELATQLRCDRVSLGFMRKKHVHVRVISHSAEFDKRMNLVRAIGSAMDEAVLQRREIVYPAPPDAGVLVIRDHEALAKLHGDESVLTIPLYGKGRYYGALALERPLERPFSKDEVELCRSVASLAASVLELKRLNDRFLIRILFDSLKRQITRIFGPGYAGRKLAALLIAATVVFFSYAKGEYRLSADTVLEGAVRRVVAAPFKGYIKDAYARAGDVVKENGALCILDDRDLRLERLNWLSRRSQLQRRHQEALAKHNRAEVNIIKAKLDQAAAQLDLVNSKLERTRINAPFEGILVRGDLSQRLGGFVEQGEVLFEVTPLDSYRLILQVDERRIADVREDQQGSLRLSSLPEEEFDFVIEKITPITTAEEGRNYFRVEARLKNISGHLRPGMEGVGKISIDRRKYISIWTRNLVEWLRLWVWSWWP